MPIITFKEGFMLLLGFGLIYSLYYLRTHEAVFDSPAPLTTSNTSDVLNLKTADEPTTKILPKADREEVQIPDWLSNKSDFDLSNLTIDDLLRLAKISHEQNHDFFPDNQNTLFYLLKAKELGIDPAAIDELMTTLHATLYDQAEHSIRNYDAQTLTALTARLKSIDPNDPKIQPYTDQISLIYTLERLSDEITTHTLDGRLYEADQNDAIHTLLVALSLDQNYPPLLEAKSKLLEQTSELALRSAQELDFPIADVQINIMNEIAPLHPITQATINDIQNQKQNRFAYLDQQFYNAINSLNLVRAQNMIDELVELEIDPSQISEYQILFNKTKTFGPYEVGTEFNNLLQNGANGPTMVVMPLGSFYMGSQIGPKHQRPRHKVDINYGFAVSRTEITVGEFKQFIDATKYKTTAEQKNRSDVYDERTGRFNEKYNINWTHDYLGKNAALNLPVIHVSWDDANAYATWLNATSGEGYRLLSETEFEYILAANSETIYPWGNEPPTQVWGNFSGAKDKFKKSRIRWREGFADYEDGYWGPAPVGSFIKSLFGLNDLSGNVMEWVADCWHDSYTRAPNDGSAWVNRGCEERVIRGGNWGSAIEEYQIHHRVKAKATLTDPRLGFRVAKSLVF